MAKTAKPEKPATVLKMPRPRKAPAIRFEDVPVEPVADAPVPQLVEVIFSVAPPAEALRLLRAARGFVPHHDETAAAIDAYLAKHSSC